MAALELDGITVNIEKDSGSHKPLITGKQGGMVQDGSPANDRQTNRRSWGFKTVPLVDREAEGLIGLLQGRGQTFGYGTDLVSSAGHSPTGTAVATIIPGKDLQTSPALVYQESSGELDGKFWGGSLEMGPATTNLLDADSRDAENGDPPAGFSAILSATLSAETSIVLQGTQSLKTVTPATSQSGTRTTTISLSVATDYAVSIYVYCTSATELKLQAYDGSATFITKTYTPTANVWERVEATGTTTGGAGAGAYLELLVNSATAVTFYADMLQLEAGDVATPWVDGSRAAPSLRYDGITDISDNLTFCCWTRAPSADPGATGYLMSAFDGAGNDIYLRRVTPSNHLVFATTNEDVAGVDSITDTSTWDDAWHHVALVMSARASGGYRDIRLYIDGIESGSVVPATRYANLRGKGSSLYIGNLNGLFPWWGPIQEVLVLPYAMSTAQILALAGRTRRLPGLPYLDAAGTFDGGVADDTRDHNFKVLGRVKNAALVGNIIDSNGYKSYNRVVDFEMISVGEI